MYYVLYNPLSGNKQGADSIEKIKPFVKDEMKAIDVRDVTDFSTFFDKLNNEDAVVLCGGDGTLNHFVNDIADVKIKNDVYLFASGSGNDFKTDVAPDAEGLVKINEYIQNLPVVEVKGMKRRFINGIGYGIDGYCCEVGDELAQKSDKPINYAGIAVKGLLFHYKPANAVVTVDGETHEFKHVWLAPSMNGRYYGGGMKVAPAQERLASPKTLSLVVWHGTGKITTLLRFKSIFTGEHIKYQKSIHTFAGKVINVKFDRPTALQIDGETVSGVTEYTVYANA
ncbi:MAG: diacylglycerol kinase family protein [Ruminococcaceae bacterium]|nr:diacylglycerol kinase family protein [Oscillospiraceae bacterium]